MSKRDAKFIQSDLDAYKQGLDGLKKQAQESVKDPDLHKKIQKAADACGDAAEHIKKKINDG